MKLAIFALFLAVSLPAAERPNIVLILSGDLSYRDLSSYGQKHYQTPNLDTLVAGGLRFTRAYAGSPECAPTRASILTGMHMGHCRIRANNSARGQDHLLDSDVTIAEMLNRGFGNCCNVEEIVSSRWRPASSNVAVASA